ncbi:cellulase/esterase CelE [Clostridiales bacterium]|nr:cellulase/esterase CelE [Lachnospiraceae bacterium]GFI62394.1 cellulase/esterase CelE [Clostridiales bacterium]
MAEIDLDREELIYSGRIDKRNAKRPEFIFPASYLHFRFRGCRAVLTVENKNFYWDNYAGALVDGVQKKWLLNHTDQTEIILVDDPQDGEHEILFFKRQDSCHEMTLCSLSLSEGASLLPPPPIPERRIEVYGDSVSAGEVSEALPYIGKEDPPHNGEYSNSWYSYAWLTARRLNAQLHNIAQGGIALMNNTGWFHKPHAIGMESIWDKVHYAPEEGFPTSWDFKQYIPDAVIVALGQNDSHPYDFMKEEPSGTKAARWRECYKEFLVKLRCQYPEAHVICCTTLLNHDKSWDESIEQVCHELSDKKISHYLFRRNGQGTPGHLRIPEAEEMAEELAAYMEQTVYLK